MLLASPARAGHAHTRRHLRLVNVQRRRALDDRLHLAPSQSANHTNRRPGASRTHESDSRARSTLRSSGETPHAKLKTGSQAPRQEVGVAGDHRILAHFHAPARVRQADRTLKAAVRLDDDASALPGYRRVPPRRRQPGGGIGCALRRSFGRRWPSRCFPGGREWQAPPRPRSGCSAAGLCGGARPGPRLDGARGRRPCARQRKRADVWRGAAAMRCNRKSRPATATRRRRRDAKRRLGQRRPAGGKAESVLRPGSDGGA